MNRISYLIPVFNEVENLRPLFDELSETAERVGVPYEVIFVDDGSTDGSGEVLQEIARAHPAVRVIAMDRNSGQSAALAAGFAHATGDVIITLDADGQNDPADIPRLLRWYGEYDVVNGWRRVRRDRWSKRVASRVGNAVRNRLTGEKIRDTGCSLKVMNAAMVKRVKMFRGLHRFLPTLLRLEGARVIEVEVQHRPRRHGVSKYSNWRRAREGWQDLWAVRWMIRRAIRTGSREISPGGRA
jgi:dolichol-phosphate mannosyltransferase